MKYNIHGKKIKVTPSIKQYIEEKVGKLDKYLAVPDDVIANIVVRISGNDQIVEVTINMPKLILRAEERDNDLYSAIDLVSDKLERQLRKNKTRIKKRIKENNILDFEIDKIEEDNKKIVKRKNIENKPMSEEEAMLQMELLGHSFFVFNNSDNDTDEIIYIRKDGNYGIIEIK